MAEAEQAPRFAAQGILTGTKMPVVLLIVLGSRQGFKEALATIAPLTAAVEMTKQTIICDCVNHHHPS